MDALNNDGLSRLASIMEEQVQLLRRMDERQAAADLSSQPIPEVPIESNSTWGPLLRSRVAETIQPKVERWRSGLDALLVFLGLFSSIVTAFLVDSLNGLQPDEVARTNQLLANLTEIVIQLNTGAALHITSPPPFAPDPVNVRLNSYWFISLILSLSVAALAVACRGFLNMALLSNHIKAVDRLIDINGRWKRAEKILGPAVEVIPQLLIIPVLLFVVGLLDNVFSSVLALAVLPVPIAAASAVSLLFLVGLVGFLVFALSDAIIRPYESPFPSTLARVTRSILPITENINYWLNLPSLSSTYHEVVQATHDDDTLDCAAAALLSVLEGKHSYATVIVESGAGATLVHLLSPEASRRCNHTAARTIVHCSHMFRPRDDFQCYYLLDPLTQAARRSVSFLPLVTLWHSAYVKALAAIILPNYNPLEDYPPVMSILGSGYMTAWSAPKDDPILGSGYMTAPKDVSPVMSFLVSGYMTTLLDRWNLTWPQARDLLLDVFFEYFRINSTVEASADQNQALPSAVVLLFEPHFIWPQHVLALAQFLWTSRQQERALILVSLLVAAKTPVLILALAHERISNEDQSGNIHDLSDTLVEGYLVIKSVLTHFADLNNDFSMADLCSACVLGVKRCIERKEPCLVYSRDALRTLEAALQRFPSHSEANKVLADLVAQCTDKGSRISLSSDPLSRAGDHEKEPPSRVSARRSGAANTPQWNTPSPSRYLPDNFAIGFAPDAEDANGHPDLHRSSLNQERNSEQSQHSPRPADWENNPPLHHDSPTVQPATQSSSKRSSQEMDYGDAEPHQGSSPRHNIGSSTGQSDVPTFSYGLSDVSPVDWKRPEISFDESGDSGEGLRSHEGARGLRRSSAVTMTIGARPSPHSSLDMPMESPEGGAPASLKKQMN